MTIESTIKMIAAALISQGDPNAVLPLDSQYAHEETLAFRLASRPEGLSMLEYDNYELARKISANTLNHIITGGSNKGQSVAWLLARSDTGRDILKSNNCKLALLISDDTLSHVIPAGDYKGGSVKDELIKSSDRQLRHRLRLESPPDLSSAELLLPLFHRRNRKRQATVHPDNHESAANRRAKKREDPLVLQGSIGPNRGL